jgi:hypothetical protein
MRRIAALLGLSLILLGLGCSTSEHRVVPLKLPGAYGNVQRVEGVYVAARAWDQEEAAQTALV